jgi:hypothetical protein
MRTQQKMRFEQRTDSSYEHIRSAELEFEDATPTGIVRFRKRDNLRVLQSRNDYMEPSDRKLKLMENDTMIIDVAQSASETISED